MRQLIFASAFGTTTGNVGFSKIADDGAVTAVTAPAANAKIKKGNFIFFRSNSDGGNILYPFYNSNFSYSHATGSAATTFAAALTIPGAAIANGTYTIIFAKKGVKFNERNKWSVSVPVKSGDAATTIAAKLRTAITNSLSDIFTVTTASTAVITVTAKTSGEDWKMLGADDLMGTNGVASTSGAKGFVDVNYIKDLAAKAIADLGYDSTYVDANVDLLPGSDKLGVPSAVNPDSSVTYHLFTIRFSEPRETKTRDEVVNQIIQVVVPAAGATLFENILKTIDGTYSAG